MELNRLTGPSAGAVKYDVLTALSVAGLNGSITLQTSMMRLIALVTARYNWRSDELTVGQRDMARMWSVTERTVKREMKRLMQAGVLVCKRAGVRGRVAAFRLNYGRIAELSKPCWQLVGPDFEARMSERYAADTVKVVLLTPVSSTPTPELPTCGKPWPRIMARLAKEHPSAFGSWFSHLEFIACETGTLQLKAPGAFIRRYIETHLIGILTLAVEDEFGPIRRIVLA